MNTYVTISAFSTLVMLAILWHLCDSMGHDKRGRICIYITSFVLTVAAALSCRYLQYTQPDNKLGGAILKFCASAPSVILALRGFLAEKNRFDLTVLCAIIIGLISDVVINLNLKAGAAMFAIGHIMYDIAFIREKRPSKKQILIWILLSLAGGAAVFSLRNKVASFPLVIFGAVYQCILVSTVVFSFSLKKIIFAAACIFAVSDIFLIYNMVAQSPFILTLLSLIIYYVSLLAYGIAIWKISYPHEKL